MSWVIANIIIMLKSILAFNSWSWGSVASFLVAFSVAPALAVIVTVSFAFNTRVFWVASIHSSVSSIHLGVVPVVWIVAEVPVVILRWKMLNIQTRNGSSHISLEAFESFHAISIRVAVSLANVAWVLFCAPVAWVILESSWESFWQMKEISFDVWIVTVIIVKSDSLEAGDTWNWSVVGIFLPASQTRLAVSIFVTISFTNATWVRWCATISTFVLSYYSGMKLNRNLFDWTFENLQFRLSLLAGETVEPSIDDGTSTKKGSKDL